MSAEQQQLIAIVKRLAQLAEGLEHGSSAAEAVAATLAREAAALIERP